MKLLKKENDMQSKIKWMKKWCELNGVELALEGTVGFGRKCVGISAHGQYPDYDSDELWSPERAYHKHDCVAVLGWDDGSVDQLYQWLKYFNENNYCVSITDNPEPAPTDELEKLVYQEKFLEIVKGER